MNLQRDVTFESDSINGWLPFSPWSGHRLFAYDLVNLINPSVIVELGTHYGCSLFSFAQAVKDNKLDSQIYAVDTWEGDRQAGFYGPEVWELVNRTKDTLYDSQNISLLRMLFDDAVGMFENEAIDVLHIDGCHDYEFVKTDFYTWLPKMKRTGVILLHDIAPHTGYGSSLFWNEVKLEYPNCLEFEHSWGLGIIFLDDNTFESMSSAIDLSSYVTSFNELADSIKVSASNMYFEELSRVEEIKFLQHQVETCRLEIQNFESTVNGKDEYIDSLEKTSSRLQLACDDCANLLIEKDIYIQQLHTQLQGNQEEFKKWQENLEEKDRYISRLHLQLQENQEEFKKWQENLQGKDRYISQLLRELEIKDSKRGESELAESLSNYTNEE